MRYTECMTQIIARVPEDLVRQVDELVSQGLFGSRSDVVRAALTRLVDRHRRDEIGRQIVEGYTRVPQTDEESLWSEADMKAMIEEEPW
jgi:Arc/MetJ-type ribon-helix-helix transcriptional regulator